MSAIEIPEGMIVRKISHRRIETWRASDKPRSFAKEVGFVREWFESVKFGDNEIKLQKVEYENTLGGKFLVMFDDGQGSMIQFSLRTCGVGDTLEDAVRDYYQKKGAADDSQGNNY